MSKTLINGVLSNINGSKYVSVTLECDSTITNMKYAFCNCNTLVSFNSIGLENVTNAYQMFCFCENLTSIDTSGFTGITNAIGMFAGCTSLTSIDASSFENVTSAYQMFDSCENLTSIDVSGFTSVTETDMMFNQCKNLLFITGGEIFNSNLTSYYREFFACKSLRRIFCNTETNVTATKEFLTNDTYLPSTFDVSTMVRQGVDFSKLNDTLASLATNTAATPYEMNVLNYTADNLAGSPSAKENTFQYILKNNSKKYVTLNCILDDDGNVDYSAVCVNTTQSNLISSLNSRPYITASNLAETGYVKWSNGLLIQWGHASTSSCQSSDGAWNKISITMPLSYKSSSSYEVMATAAPAVNVPNSHCEVDGKDSGNVFHTYECYTQRGTHWIAIGKA